MVPSILFVLDVGKVYLAVEKETGKKVAMKVMFIHRFVENQIAQQLRDELQVGVFGALAIQIHSHLIHNRITRVYGAFIDKQRGKNLLERLMVVGIVMEYAKKGTLFNIMVKNNWMKGMPMKYVQQVALQVYS